MYFIYYFRMTGQAYHKVHKSHPHHTQPLHIKPAMSSPEPRVPRQGMGNILEAMRCGQGERVPGWHSTAPPHPQTPVALGPLPAPQPEHQSGVSSPLHGADGAPRIGKVPSRVLGLVVWQGSAPSPCAAPGLGLPNWCHAVRAESPPRASQAPSVLAGTATAPSSAGRGAGFKAGFLPGLAHFLPAHFPQSPPVPVTQVRSVPMGKVATWEGGTALSSGCLPPAAPPTLLWDQGQPQQPPSGPTSVRARVGTKRREEERAKVELTYRWLFKSIKGR